MSSTFSSSTDYCYFNGNITPLSVFSKISLVPEPTVYDNCYYNAEQVPIYSRPTIKEEDSISEE